MSQSNYASTDEPLSATPPVLVAEGDKVETDLKRHRWAAHVLLFAAVVGVFASNWRFAFTNGYFDTIGGASTIGAMRVLFGEIPYRDFWTSMAPGSFYLLAFLFRLFGTELMVEVIASSILCALAVVVYFS